MHHHDPWQPPHRQRNKIRRNDLIDLMLDAVEDDKKEIDEVILLGNSLIFLIAGYDSTGLTLSYAFWHLGGNSINIGHIIVFDQKGCSPSGLVNGRVIRFDDLSHDSILLTC